MSSDWESIMNGVFGSGGRFTGKSAGPAEPEKAPEKDAAPARPRDTDPLAALQRNADAMNEALRRQAEELAAMGMRSREAERISRAEQQAAEATALSGRLTEQLAQDGLLTPRAPDPADGYTGAVRAGLPASRCA